jgi:hypothetical protein
MYIVGPRFPFVIPGDDYEGNLMEGMESDGTFPDDVKTLYAFLQVLTDSVVASTAENATEDGGCGFMNRPCLTLSLALSRLGNAMTKHVVIVESMTVMDELHFGSVRVSLSGMGGVGGIAELDVILTNSV